MAKPIYKLNEVFVAGGFPNVTYVERKALKLEQKLERALEKPNHFVSMTGVSKSGKTVLLRNFLSSRNFIGVDGGQVTNVATLWTTIANRLSQPKSVTHVEETEKSSQTSQKLGISAQIPHFLKFSGGVGREASDGTRSSVSVESVIDLQNECGRYLIENEVVLVIDDFPLVSQR